MSDYQSPLGSLSSGQLLGDSPSGPTPPPRKTPWAAIVVVAAVVLLLVGVVAGAALLVLSGGDDSDDPVASTQAAPETTEDERDAEPTPEEPAEPRPEKEPREEEPSEPASLLSEEGTASAMRQIRSAAKGKKALTLRVDSSSITAIVEGNVLIYRDGKLQKLPGPPSAPIGFDLGDVDTRAPARIAGAVREKGKQVDYVAYVANPIDDEQTWSVFLRGGGTGYSADRSGRNLCPLGKQC